MGWITSLCGWCRGQRHGLASRRTPALNADTLPRSGFVQCTLCRRRHKVHKTANVLAKLPKSQQPKAKRALQEIWMAETKAAAELAFDAFIERYTPKIREGRRLPEQGSGHATRVLRLPGRALEALADYQSH